MLCGINTSGTYIPPSTPQMVFIIEAVPFALIVLKVKNTLIIEIDDVIIAPSNKATKNKPNEAKLVGNISLMLLGSRKATVKRGTQRIIVPDSLKPRCSAYH